MIMKFRTMFQYMDEQSSTCIIPEDTGDNRVQPDLSLSPKQIMERWTRNLPLDIVTRNGSYMLDGVGDEDLPDDVYDIEDPETMDMVDAEAYLSNRASKMRTRTSQKAVTTEDDEPSLTSEPASGGELGNSDDGGNAR